MRERLGTAPVITAPKSPNSESKPSNEIRIKTLEEIRQEKAAKSQMQCKVVKVVTGAPTNASPSTKRDKPVSGPTIKTFSEILHDKKKLQETKLVPHQGSTNTEKTEGPINTGVIKLTAQSAKIKVKTLEEIRKEKADRMQAKTQDTTNNACTSSDAVPKRRLIRVGKTGGKLVCPCAPPPVICGADIYYILFTGAVNIRSQKVQDSEKVDCIEEARPNCPCLVIIRHVISMHYIHF